MYNLFTFISFVLQCQCPAISIMVREYMTADVQEAFQTVHQQGLRGRLQRWWPNLSSSSSSITPQNGDLVCDQHIGRNVELPHTVYFLQQLFEFNNVLQDDMLQLNLIEHLQLAILPCLQLCTSLFSSAYCSVCRRIPKFHSFSLHSVEWGPTLILAVLSPPFCDLNSPGTR